MQRLKSIFKEDELLLSTIYERENDILTMVLKNVNTGNKRLITLPNPKVPIYITKEKNPKEYKEFCNIKDLEIRYVNEKYREWNIARELNIKNFNELVKENKMEAKDIYLNKRLFSSDIDLVDNVIREYTKFFTHPTEDGYFKTDLPLVEEFHIGGLDIETDIMISDKMEEQPVIVNTYVDGKDWTVYTKCLINENYNGQKEMMEDIEGFKVKLQKVLHEHIENINLGDDSADIEKANMIKEMIKEKLDKLKYNITFTNKEEEVIKDVCNHIFSDINPDFLLIYNASFDINQMMTRYEALGKNPNELFRCKDLNPYVYINTKNMNYDLTKRIHHFDLRNPTKIIDQMLLYYQLRRAKNYAKYSLDATSNRELGVGKLDYSKFCNYIGDFPYVKYDYFVIYNIIDILVMLFLDLITRDIYSIVYKRFNMCTEWGKIAKSLERTTNIFDMYYQLQGFIPCCNTNERFINLDSENAKRISASNEGLGRVISQLKEVAKFANKDEDRSKNPYRVEGGLVSSPNLISDSIKENATYKIPIKTYNKFESCADLDATSMYPMNTIANNCSKSTLVGKIIKIGDNEDKNIGRLSALSIINKNITNIGSNFLNLPSIHEIIKDYHKIDSTIAKKNSLFYNTEEEIQIDDVTHKKAVNDIKKLWRTLYNTKYDKKDSDAGNPSNNKLFMTSDNNEIEFSYYSTKINLISNIPFNEVLNIKGKGFICGNLKKDIITNMNDEYREALIPKKEVFTTTLKKEGILSIEEIENIKKAKRIIYTLSLDDYKIDMVDRLLFADIKININISYKIYDINEDSNLFKLEFISKYETKNIAVDIKQSMICFKK